MNNNIEMAKIMASRMSNNNGIKSENGVENENQLIMASMAWRNVKAAINGESYLMAKHQYQQLMMAKVMA